MADIPLATARAMVAPSMKRAIASSGSVGVKSRRGDVLAAMGNRVPSLEPFPRLAIEPERIFPSTVSRGLPMTLGTILVIILILLLLGVIPNWGYSSSWGYGPSGIVGTILIVVLILLLLGRI
jgi:hypothetical protein